MIKRFLYMNRLELCCEKESVQINFIAGAIEKMILKHMI